MIYLLEWTAKATFILAVAWVATILARKHSAATRHTIWAVALAGVVVAPAIEWMVPPSQPHAKAPIQFAETIVASESVARATTAVQVPWLHVLWGVGCTLSLLRLTAGFLWMRRRSRPLLNERIRSLARQLSSGRDVTLITAHEDTMPMTWGSFPPKVALPAGAETWGEDRLRVVLSHELAHVGRGDWCWQIIAEIVKAIYWFHPMVWLAARRLRQESEIACDDAVLKQGLPSNIYANELLSLANVYKDSGWIGAPALAMAKTSDLERRFTSMLNPSINRSPITGKARILTFCAATTLLVSLAALRAPAQNPAGVITGTVYDPDRAVVPSAKVTATNIDTHVSQSITTNSIGAYSFNNLLPGKYQITATQSGFRSFDSPSVDLTGNQGGMVDANLTVGPMTQVITVTAQGTSSGASSSPQTPKRIRVGGNVQAANLVRQVKPPYPESARAAGIEGSVSLSAVIDKGGLPTRIRVTRSLGSEFDTAALQAVAQWRFQAALLNREPVEVVTDIAVQFKLKP